ncbi:MAG TPA: DNA-binding protein [Firmicutes bacterium]|nr:DNA-binding protein [Bacillota bacterium]HBK69800.1 DNA-binding protein [Bacillota bacterium]
MSDERYIAVIGSRHFYGKKIFKPAQIVKLVKEPENIYDDEAIRVEITPVGQVGYVANSTATVPRGCHSAGRIYDTFDQHCFGVVRFLTNETVIVELLEKVRMQIVLIEESDLNQTR